MKIKKRFYNWRINRLEKKIGQIKDQLAKCEDCKRKHLLDEEELDWCIGYMSVELFDLEKKLEKVKEKYENTK